MSTYLKICGIRRPEDVAYLNACPPDYAGFICTPGYRRSVSVGTLRELCRPMELKIVRVGVFVDPVWDEIAPFEPYLDILQLHGNESPALIAEIRAEAPEAGIWKAVRVRTAEDIRRADALDVDALVLDSFSAECAGGTGTLAPWDIIAQNRPEKPFFLAGGITPENVQEAVRAVQPYGVDASSSLETDGCKDAEKIRRMAAAVKGGVHEL
ncbi:MAG: phosphoribosylanthranilate isomerase [Oscillospiraceae bacterium]|nr:phosphoribosylanthranilate isomerase [Oscillospiraceae bacterium]